MNLSRELAACRRLVFIGTSGSGKSTAGAGARAAQLLAAPHVELDELYWAPNWAARSVADFREDVDRATCGERWVVSGNYSPVRDIVWARADTLAWLDLPFPLVFARSLTRALRRAITREPLFAGNVETIRRSFFSRNSILLWVLQTFWKRRREYPALFARPEHAHLKTYRLRSQRQVESWLSALAQPGNTPVDK